MLASDSGFEVGIKRDLCRLARFGANLSDAHSCFIFLPADLLFNQTMALGSSVQELGAQLELAGYHSLSRDVLVGSRLAGDSGLIGWVAKHKRAIHVSPFERDSRTLGVYTSDQQLKSFIGVPVKLNLEGFGEMSLGGVIACDSKKSFAFSKLQGKLVDDLAEEVSSTLSLHFKNRSIARGSDCWQDFIRDTIGLAETLGRDSLEVMRIRLKNFEELEGALGTSDCIKLLQQLTRLIRQALPAQFPCLILPNGDTLVALDVMASSFYENRIKAVASHITSACPEPALEFNRRALRDKRYRGSTVERLVADTGQSDSRTSTKQGELLYEYRRA